jgi:hypothetical protein
MGNSVTAPGPDVHGGDRQLAERQALEQVDERLRLDHGSSEQVDDPWCDDDYPCALS